MEKKGKQFQDIAASKAITLHIAIAPDLHLKIDPHAADGIIDVISKKGKGPEFILRITAYNLCEGDVVVSEVLDFPPPLLRTIKRPGKLMPEDSLSKFSFGFMNGF